MAREELTTFFFLPSPLPHAIRSGRGSLEELRIKSKSVFIQGTLAGNRSNAISLAFQLSVATMADQVPRLFRFR